jgi:hypothetical protein
MNRSKRYFLTLVLLGLTFFYGISFAARTEYGAVDTDGFQRPKEKINPQQNNAQSIDESLDGFKRPKEQEKSFSTESAQERQKAKEASDALFFENLDGFKRPKKSE